MLRATQAQVYFDNFFSYVKLMKDLKMLNIQACGTVRSNRKELPEPLVPKKGRPALQRHAYKMAQRDELCFAHWQDTKPVCVLSNFHDPTKMGIVRRRVNGQRQEVRVPECLADYQKHMKGVDLSDQMVGYYLLNHRSWKWWRRIFFHFLLVTVHNAYIVAKAVDPDRAKREWPEFQDFVEAVAHQLVTTVATRAARAKEGPLREGLQHDVDIIFDKRKTCVACARKAQPNDRRRTTKFGCVQCREPCHKECITQHIRHQNVVQAQMPDNNGDSESDMPTDDEG